MKKPGFLFVSTAFMTALASCAGTTGGEIRLASGQAALPAMEHIALSASRCWFKSGDDSFKAYRLAPELQSFSGRPRILVVPYENPGGKPLLVIEASGSPADVVAYGPLMHTGTGKRIAHDLKHWTTRRSAKGDGNC